MEKYIYDENNGLWYELQGDYDIPCLTLPAEKENKPIGVWGQRRQGEILAAVTNWHIKSFKTT